MKKHGLLTLLAAAPLLLQPWVMLAQGPSGCAMPLPEGAYWMSSPYGMRVHPLAGVPRMHLGVDLACPTGTPVHAAAGGVVAFAGRWGCYGTVLILRHPGDVVTLYAHLSRIAPGLRPGVFVGKGRVIALSGATGCVTGSHLHFEVWQAGKRINPVVVCAPFLRQARRSRSVEVMD
jgi:murein DD-endopeptidase MepM/ murein hydrolase activator NlpD